MSYENEVEVKTKSTLLVDHLKDSSGNYPSRASQQIDIDELTDMKYRVFYNCVESSRACFMQMKNGNQIRFYSMNRSEKDGEMNLIQREDFFKEEIPSTEFTKECRIISKQSNVDLVCFFKQEDEIGKIISLNYHTEDYALYNPIIKYKDFIDLDPNTYNVSKTEFYCQ